jgi:hypothetical protein
MGTSGGAGRLAAGEEEADEVFCFCFGPPVLLLNRRYNQPSFFIYMCFVSTKIYLWFCHFTCGFFLCLFLLQV